MFHSFPTFYDIVPWIAEYLYIEMLVQQFSTTPETCGYVGKLSEQHLKELFFSNAEDRVLKFNEARISEGNLNFENI